MHSSPKSRRDCDGWGDSPLAGDWVHIGGPDVTFTWSAASGATAYGLGLGRRRPTTVFFQQEVGTATSFTVNGIPANKGTIWVRLATQIQWQCVFR